MPPIRQQSALRFAPSCLTATCPAPPAAAQFCVAVIPTKKQAPARSACFLVGMTGFEPATSCSQSRRATNCATSRYILLLLGKPRRRASCCDARRCLRCRATCQPSVAATPYPSLAHPQGALGNVPNCATSRWYGMCSLPYYSKWGKCLSRSRHKFFGKKI